MILSFISGRAAEVESLDLRSSRALTISNIYVGTGYVLIRCCPRILLRMMARKIFFSFLAVGQKPSFAQLVFNLSTVSVPVFPFQGDAGTMLYRVDSDFLSAN